MKNATKSMLLSAGLACIAMSCAKNNELQPIATVKQVEQISAANGRLVFSDYTAFNKTLEELHVLSEQKDGPMKLTDWENKFHFVSLRATGVTEGAHLEQLQTNSKPTPATDLLNSFGFPITYATLINANGEYQIGQHIYWYHAGFKYQASSESELTAIKQNPASAKVKFKAGSVPLNNPKMLAKIGRALGPGAVANATTATQDPECDDKYNTGSFYLNGDPGSQRRIIYGINVFTDDQGEDPSGYFHMYQTSLNLRIKYEYYANRHGSWYSADGQTFNWQTNFSYNATSSMPYQYPASPTHTGYVNTSGSFDSSYAYIQLGSDQITTTTVDPYESTAQIQWNFDITGTIQGYPSASPSQGYNVNGSLW